MKTITPTKTLVYYDGINVFEGRDAIGGHYVGMIIDTTGDFDRYLVVGTPPECLRQFRSGMLDLRTLLLTAPNGDWYITLANTVYGDPLVLEPQNTPLVDTRFVPSEGFFLEDTPVDDRTLIKARERGNLILELSTEPPEAAEAHRIHMATHGGLLVEMQMLIRHAYRRAVSELSDQTRQSIDTTDSYVMDVVVPASAGSFNVVLEAAKPPDMFGSSELRRALQKMDDIFQIGREPEQARDRLMEHKGHLAGSYIRLMSLLSSNGTGMSYSWAEPMSAESQHGGVSERVAKELVELFSGVSSLTAESVTLVGEFERVNRGAGDWGLLTEDGVRRGKIAEGGPSLDGLRVGQVYTFECLEKVDIVEATGREKHTL